MVVFIYTYDNEDYGDVPTIYLVEQNNVKANKNNEVVRELTLFSQGSVYTYETLTEDVGKDIVPGDLIFITKDYENVIRHIQVKYSINYPRLIQGVVNGSDSNYRSAARLSASYMTAVSDGWARLTYDKSKAKDVTLEPYNGLWNLGAVNISVFNERTGTAKIADSSSLPLYLSSNMGNDYLIMVYESYGQMYDCIIYELEER